MAALPYAVTEATPRERIDGSRMTPPAVAAYLPPGPGARNIPFITTHDRVRRDATSRAELVDGSPSKLPPGPPCERQYRGVLRTIAWPILALGSRALAIDCKVPASGVVATIALKANAMVGLPADVSVSLAGPAPASAPQQGWTTLTLTFTASGLGVVEVWRTVASLAWVDPSAATQFAPLMYALWDNVQAR